ncbi:interferon-induced protein with tetratricopeptide repeats 1 [Danio rerio]|uniref:Interferon-induced protein with tetratricopeptide repeats 1 n=1 Tax=Danio rerio TaxID=7955 RepID=A0ACD6B664_DANRE|nr:interferon-induced protein with tetratricopeptide repeats 1 [Danio rerio]|eukprot:XP_021330049.1 interferon-induced protein with tetratricopeptide repeats 1 [Danio rerio]
MNSHMKCSMERLECHFNWDLGCNKHKFKELQRNMQDIEPQGIAWLVHYYNLLGFIQKSLGSDREALESLQKAESVIQEQGTEETAVRLQVNKANLAWVYFHLGELEKSRGYLEELEELQRIHPAPPGCPLHPEVSGEKGWTLVKFNKSKKHKAIDYFKMALEAEPEREEWHKGLALAMNMAFIDTEQTPELKAEILEKVKTAAEIDPNDLFLQSLYVLKKSEVKGENVDEEIQSLLEKSIETKNPSGLSSIFYYYRNNSTEKGFYEGERVRKHFPTSTKVLKIVANLHKWKVYNMKADTEQRENLARKSIELFEELLTHYPDHLKVKLALASLHQYAHNTEKANEIYQQLLSEIDDAMPHHRRQQLYYYYASFLYHSRSRHSRDSVFFYMKAAAVPEMTGRRQKSIKILEKIISRGRDPRCAEIQHFLEGLVSSD